MNKDQKKIIKDMYKKSQLYDQIFKEVEKFDYLEMSGENKKYRFITNKVGKVQQINIFWS